MNKIQKQLISKYFIFMIVGLITSFPIQAKKLSLTSDNFKFSQDKKLITASSNVLLKYKNITVTASRIQLNTETKEAWGNGNIQLTRGDKTAHTESFKFDLDNNIVTLGKTRIAVKPNEKENPVFLSADEIIDYPDIKVGKNGIITTCDLYHPHYHVSTEKFNYVPDKRITGYNVHLHFPLIGIQVPIPFLTWWWTPIYNFELGKRKIIWNFPTIGKKESPGWGWFVQNRIDYDYLNGKESSILIDWFENKGIGFGIEHQYEGFGDYGEIKAYQLNEADTGETNEVYGFTQGFKLSDELFIKTEYQKIDAEKINASIVQEQENKNVQLIYDNLGDRYESNLNQVQNFRQNIKNTNFNLKHSFNGFTPFNIIYKQNENDLLKRSNQNTTFTHKHYFTETLTVDTQVQYGVIDQEVNGKTETDQSIKLQTVFKQPINENLHLTLTMDHFIDPDEERVTSDETNGLNNFFFKEPELKIDYKNPDLLGLDFKQNIVIARYQEMQFDRSRGTFNIFPAKEDYDLLPNTYRFTTNTGKTWDNLWNNGKFSITTHYDQYIFKTEGKSLFEGDAFYKLQFRIGYSQQITPFLNSSTSLDQTYIDEEGYIPYLTTLITDRTNIRNFQQDFNFFIEDPNKYGWSHKLIYDFENERWNQYNTKITIKPNKEFLLTATTALDLNRLNTYLNNEDKLEFKTQGIFQPLIVNWNFQPTKSISFKGNYARNINEGLLRNSNFSINFTLGEDKDYKWTIQTLFDYDTQTDLREFDLNNYEMQTYSLIKQEHCRRYKISYNKRREEFRFEVVILAFPKDPISIEKTQNVWRVKGFLDKGIKERF